ncbi:MAG TPA: peroxiredoxin [Candidatus Nanoarchaeia archaeon]|nr:peroxiredoxin [Candidatus Nanoarchaeia archaeon]
MLKINQPAPEFMAKAYHQDAIKEISLKDYKGKWLILFFYPGDFTFVCPTELGELAKEHDALNQKNVEILSVSTDSVYVHKAWHDESKTISKVNFPMLSDQSGSISKDYHTYIEDEGISLRGTFLIDPEGILKTLEIHHNPIGRNIQETIRKLEAAIHVYKNGEQACPANWNPGKETLKPGLDLVGKI